MPLQMLLPLSKFNKKHIDAIVEDNQLVKVNESTITSLRSNDLDSIKSIYSSPNIQPISYGNNYFSNELQQYFQNIIVANTVSKNNLAVLSPNYINLCK